MHRPFHGGAKTGRISRRSLNEGKRNPASLGDGAAQLLYFEASNLVPRGGFALRKLLHFSRTLSRVPFGLVKFTLFEGLLFSCFVAAADLAFSKKKPNLSLALVGSLLL